MRTAAIVTLLAAALLLAAPAAPGVAEAENWPAWRGPTADGVSTETHLPVEWDTGRNVAWRLPMLPAWSGSTPIRPEPYGVRPDTRRRGRRLESGATAARAAAPSLSGPWPASTARPARRGATRSAGFSIHVSSLPFSSPTSCFRRRISRPSRRRASSSSPIHSGSFSWSIAWKSIRSS